MVSDHISDVLREKQLPERTRRWRAVKREGRIIGFYCRLTGVYMSPTLQQVLEKNQLKNPLVTKAKEVKLTPHKTAQNTYAVEIKAEGHTRVFGHLPPIVSKILHAAKVPAEEMIVERDWEIATRKSGHPFLKINLTFLDFVQKREATELTTELAGRI